MKVSFSLSSSTKPQSTLKKPSCSSASASPTGEESTEFITEYVSSKAPIQPSQNRQNRIIPPKPNEWMPHLNITRQNLLNLPPQFEVESSAATPSDEDPTSNSIIYGLNLRSKSGHDNALVEKNPTSLMSDVDSSLIKLREDLKRLAEVTGFDEFEDMPVEGFGRALLAGYGWVEGMGIGRNAKEDVKVVECKRWASTEGLGFTRIVP